MGASLSRIEHSWLSGSHCPPFEKKEKRKEKKKKGKEKEKNDERNERKEERKEERRKKKKEDEKEDVQSISQLFTVRCIYLSTSRATSP